MKKRLLVTGLSGFVGQHLKTMLSTQYQDTVELVYPDRAWVDLNDAVGLHAWVAAARPDWVIHLAAQSFVPTAFKDPRATFAVNFEGTLNLLMALAAIDFTGRFLFVGSGDIYGTVAEANLPVVETLAPKPRNPYAVSKVAAEALCYQWSQTGAFDIMMARPFNHIGPKQSPHFAIADFATQIMAIKAGKQEPRLVTGNISVSRDFSDVRDIVCAYLQLLQQGQNGEVYNIASGQERTIRSLITEMLNLAGVHAVLVEDETRFRPNEQTRMVASCTKLREHTGFIPLYTLKETLQAILEEQAAIIETN